MAPTLASIVVYEEEYLAKLHQQPLVWIRYIKDVLMIWPHPKQDLVEFLHGLNLLHSNLRFTMDTSYIYLHSIPGPHNIKGC